MTNIDAEKKLAEIENITVKFIKSLGESAIKDLAEVDPETKTMFMIDVLKTLHNKDA
jgi:hypothetical protein